MRERFSRPAALLAGPGLFFAGRVGALTVLASLFRAWNLNERTWDYAPRWAQAVAEQADLLADIAALIVALAALMILLPRRKAERTGMAPLFFLVGMAVCFVCIGILVATGSARIPRMVGSWARIWALTAREILLSIAAVLWLRGALTELLRKAGKLAALVVSAAAEGILFCAVTGAWQLTPALNGALTALVFLRQYEKKQRFLPEALLCAGFRFTECAVLLFPDRVNFFVISEPWLTGESAGSLLGSGVLCVMLAVVLLRPYVKRLFARGV